jgi:hypothetical protein
MKGFFICLSPQSEQEKSQNCKRQSFEGTSSGPRLHPESGQMLESPYANHRE